MRVKWLREVAAGAAGDIDAGKFKHHLFGGGFDLFREVGGLSGGLADQGDSMFPGDIGVVQTRVLEKSSQGSHPFPVSPGKNGEASLPRGPS